MAVDEPERALAAGPAMFSFSDMETDGTVLVTDQRTLLVWLNRTANLYLNSTYDHASVEAYRAADGDPLGVQVQWRDDPGSMLMRIKLDRRDGVANRRALEWYYTLAEQFRAEFARRRGETTIPDG